MNDEMELLITFMLKYDASDAHFVLRKERLDVQLRTAYGMKEIKHMALSAAFFRYLKFIANLDLAAASLPQSGNFTFSYQEKPYYFRFSTISNMDTETGVLRILNNHDEILLEDLSREERQYESFLRWTRMRSGLCILCGPTGSGKSTTLHALLKRIVTTHRLQVVSLEDPIEIHDDAYLQLQINEKNNFTYEQGIRQLLRHDPDVIMIGEVRDPSTAQMVLRCALSGHMVFTTLHAKCCSEAIKRLNEFGISNEELLHTLTAVCAQRLYPSLQTEGRVCIYEILELDELQYYLQKKELSNTHATIFDKIQEAVECQWISKEAALIDLENTP